MEASTNVYTIHFKERVHSEMKISYKIKLDPSIMPFAFFFSKNVSIPSDINSSPKIPLPGPALSLPGTCIITSRDLHYCFRGLAFSLPGPSLLLPGPALSLPGPALSLPGPALLLPDLHYFTVTVPSRKINQTEGIEPNRHNH